MRVRGFAEGRQEIGEGARIGNRKGMPERSSEMVTRFYLLT